MSCQATNTTGPPRASRGPSPNPQPQTPCSLDKDLPPLLVIKEAEAMAGAKGYKTPLRVQSQGGDHGWGLALDQDKGLKAWLKADGPRAGGEALVPLPAVALLVLKQVSLHALHSVFCRLIVQLQHQHLGWCEGGRQFSGAQGPQHGKGLGNQDEVLCLTPALILISGAGAQATLGATHYGESSILRLPGKSCRRAPDVAAR